MLLKFFLAPTTILGFCFESTVAVLLLTVLLLVLKELKTMLSLDSNSFCCFFALSPIEKNDGTAAARATTATKQKAKTGRPELDTSPYLYLGFRVRD